MKFFQDLQDRRFRLVGWGMILSVAVILPLLFFPPSAVEGQQGIVSRDLSGYAWSSNIGWISFKGTTSSDNKVYGVILDSGKLIGEAWSSNIGWIRFSEVVGETPPSGTRSGVSLSGTNVVGWARACAVFKPNTCAGELKLDSDRGGWDGWISMGGTSPNYGVIYDSVTGQFGASGQKSFAWGSTNLGWIDFCPFASNQSLGSNACVKVDSLGFECKVYDDSNDALITGSVAPAQTIKWKTTSIIGGSDPYEYAFCWGTSCAPDDLDGKATGSGNNVVENAIVSDPYTVTPSDLLNLNIVAEVEVKQGANKRGKATCSISVADPSTPTLTVVVQGDFGYVSADTPPSPSPVLGSGPISNCRFGSNSCRANYLTTDSVQLGAAPDPTGCSSLPSDPPSTACEFVRWEVDGVVSPSGCSATGPGASTCLVDMDDSKTVVAVFRDPGAPPATDLDLKSTPPRLEINFHNQGQLAETVTASISTIETNSAILNEQLCIESFKDALGRESRSGNFKCQLGDYFGNCEGVNVCQNFTPVSVSGGHQVIFKVQAPNKITNIPKIYFIKLKVKEGAGFTGEITIPFTYTPSGGGP